MGEDVSISHGSLGQFDILVDGRVVSGRSGSILSHLFGKGWPSTEEVVQSIREGAAGRGDS